VGPSSQEIQRGAETVPIPGAKAEPPSRVSLGAKVATAYAPILPELAQHGDGLFDSAANTTTLVRLTHCAATPRTRWMMIWHWHSK
jgi:hypothetical protein